MSNRSLYSSWIIITLLAAFIGCSGSSEDSDAKTETTSGSSGSSETPAARCETKLAAAMQRIQPMSLATQTRPDLVVNSLNSWLTECARDRIAELNLGDATSSLLSPSAIRFATAGRFTLNDTAYIRDCLLLKNLTERVWGRADAAAEGGLASERTRVIALFHAVNQLVSLMPADEDRVPIGLYETLLTGRGYTEDRIWLFAEALRQRQIDCVVLECAEDQKVSDPSGSDDPLSSASFLIAVFAQPDVLLFDPVRVCAVPKPGDRSASVTSPAGLTELQASERWKDAAVQLAAQPATSSPRMLVLQENMAAEDAALLFDELGGGTSEFTAQRDRIAEASAGAITADQIAVWPYPEQRIIEAGDLDETQRQQYAILMKPFDAPFERDPLKADDSLDDIDVSEEGLTPEERMQLMNARLQERIARMNESSEEIFGKASRRLMKVRIDQVMGDSELGVIQQLQQIRIASMHDYVEIQVRVTQDDQGGGFVRVPLPDAIKAIHSSATGNALYWSAMCQIDRGDDGAAVITLRNYRTQYPEGSHYQASLVHEALALLRMGADARAVELLASVNLDIAPERLRIEWILSRLSPENSATEKQTDSGEGDEEVPSNTPPKNADETAADNKNQDDE